MLLRSFSSHTFIMLELHIQSRVTCLTYHLILSISVYVETSTATVCPSP